MINIFERRRYLIILITILYFFGILEQIFNSENFLDFLSNIFFQLSTIIYIFSVTFVIRLISSARKIKRLSNEIISGKFINDINLVKAKDSYDKATYEIIDSFSKELSKEKNLNFYNCQKVVCYLLNHIYKYLFYIYLIILLL